MKRKVKWIKEILEEYYIAFQDGNMLIASHPLGKVICEIPSSKLKWLGKEIEVEEGSRHYVTHGDMSSSFFDWPKEVLEPLPKDEEKKISVVYFARSKEIRFFNDNKIFVPFGEKNPPIFLSEFSKDQSPNWPEIFKAIKDKNL